VLVESCVKSWSILLLRVREGGEGSEAVASVVKLSGFRIFGLCCA
jgi:hypothetical protein